MGITRAKEKLYLLSSPSEPSEFLSEIPDNLLQKGPATEPKHQYEGKQLSFF